MSAGGDWSKLRYVRRGAQAGRTSTPILCAIAAVLAMFLAGGLLLFGLGVDKAMKAVFCVVSDAPAPAMCGATRFYVARPGDPL